MVSIRSVDDSPEMDGKTYSVLHIIRYYLYVPIYINMCKAFRG